MERTNQPRGKRHKSSGLNLQKTPSVDRLSALPDAILCHILSFLPTKTSVSTSILAERWRSMWAHVPSLNFESRHLSILDIITRFLLLYKVANIDSFRLSCPDAARDGWTNFRLRTCMIAVARCKVKNLRLCLKFGPVVLPPCIFTCKTLVDLEIDCSGGITISGAVCLPILKRLCVDSVNQKSIISFVHLLSGCPVLEDLAVSFLGKVDCNISSPTINRLRLSGMSMVKIKTPSLRYLQLNDCLPECVSDQVLLSLAEVEIMTKTEPTAGQDMQFMYNANRFLKDLHNVKCLKLSTATSSWVFGFVSFMGSASTIKFPNLARLELNPDLFHLPFFLENADNLEVLVIEKVTGWFRPLGDEKCLTSHLRIVTIGGFECKELEFEFIRYLLLNAKVLKRMTIYSQVVKGDDIKAKFHSLKRISLFPRGSMACELDFH